MRVVFSIPAIADLDNINHRIRLDCPNAARRVPDRIKSASTGLSDFPYLRRPGLTEGTRELVVSGGPYLLVYEVDERAGTVLVLNVFHGSQDRGSSERR